VKVFHAALPARRKRWPVPGPEYDAAEAVALDALASRPHAALARKILVAARVAKLPVRGLPSVE
jgi:hypothetical protein